MKTLKITNKKDHRDDDHHQAAGLTKARNVLAEIVGDGKGQDAKGVIDGAYFPTEEEARKWAEDTYRIS